MAENFIIIENVSEKEIESILMDLANLYADTGYTDAIQLYKKNNKNNSFLILFSNPPDFARFNYFVNYLRYPSGYEKLNPFLRGYYQTKDININNEFIVGDWIMVYVSESDKEYDNVYLVNKNEENYLYDFGGKIRKLNTTEERFNIKIFDITEYNHIIDIIPSVNAKEKIIKPWWKLW